MVRMNFDLLIVLLFGLIWLGLVLFLRSKKSRVWLFFFTIFYVYIFKVLDYTLFQYQALILLKLFNPNLILNGQVAGKELNLIPLITLTSQDVKTSLENILLMLPFGFGLPFITKCRMKKVVLLGALFSILIECMQFISGYLAHITFRVVDVNDVIFNTLGTAVGFLVFLGFAYLYRRLSSHRELSANPILRYVTERAQVNKE